MRRLFLFALLATLPGAVAAQIKASAAPHFSPPPRPAAPVSTVTGTLGSRPEFAAVRHLLRNSPFLPPFYPFGPLSDFYPNDGGSAGYPIASQPPIIVLPTVAAGGAPGPSEPPPPPRALIIELQGDRYVRLPEGATSDVASVEQQPVGAATAAGSLTTKSRIATAHAPQSPNTVAATSTAATHTSAASEIPPAVLIFRDGHSEEVRDYTIADGILYARGDYYTDGYWNKKINLSALNLPQTLKCNAAHSIQFLLPKSPNEVVTRP